MAIMPGLGPGSLELGGGITREASEFMGCSKCEPPLYWDNIVGCMAGGLIAPPTCTGEDVIPRGSPPEGGLP